MLASSRMTCPGLNKLLGLRPDCKTAKSDVLSRVTAYFNQQVGKRLGTFPCNLTVTAQRLTISVPTQHWPVPLPP